MSIFRQLATFVDITISLRSGHRDTSRGVDISGVVSTFLLQAIRKCLALAAIIGAQENCRASQLVFQLQLDLTLHDTGGGKKNLYIIKGSNLMDIVRSRVWKMINYEQNPHYSQFLNILRVIYT